MQRFAVCVLVATAAVMSSCRDRTPPESKATPVAPASASASAFAAPKAPAADPCTGVDVDLDRAFATAACAQPLGAPKREPWPEGLELRLEPPAEGVKSGDYARIVVVFVNGSKTPVTLRFENRCEVFARNAKGVRLDLPPSTIPAPSVPPDQAEPVTTIVLLPGGRAHQTGTFGAFALRAIPNGIEEPAIGKLEPLAPATYKLGVSSGLFFEPPKNKASSGESSIVVR